MKKGRVLLANGVFVGVVLIVIAVSMVLCKAGVIPATAYTVFMSILMGAIAVRSLISLNFSLACLGLGHLAHLYSDFLGIPDSISPWMLILASLVVGIGLDLIFKGLKKKIKNKDVEYRSFDGKDKGYDSHGKSAFNKSNGSISGSTIHIENAFGEQTRYVNSENFSSAHIENGFGSLNVYFDNVTLENNQASLHVENGFGQINLYFPSAWRLNLTEDNGLGEIVVNGNPSIETDAPVINAHVENGLGKVNLYFN